MVSCSAMDSLLEDAGVQLFTGVPDSCFLPWVNYLLQVRPNSHITATNEGEALSIARVTISPPAK